MKTQMFVYFIKPVGLDGPVKIGCSGVTGERLQTLAVWSPWPLEVVVSAPGTFEDERFLHSCFADSHSHREWFHSTAKIRETMALIASGKSLAEVRADLKPVGSIRSRIRKPVPEYRKRLRSYEARVRNARAKLRNLGEDTAWHEPSDVAAILRRWHGTPYRHINGVAPTDAEMARLDEYLTNPAAHSIVPEWRREKAAA